MSIYRRCILSVLSAVLVEVAVPNSEVFAQTFPSRAIRLVVPFAAGGSTDVVARIVAAEMSKVLGQQVVVDNKPGAGGSIGSAEVAKSAPDGYTILAATVSTHAINPSLYTKLAFDAAKEFQPLVHLVNVPNVLVVHPSVPVKTVSDLRDYAKANPDKLNYASVGLRASVLAAGILYRGRKSTFRDAMLVPQLVFLPRARIAGSAAIFSLCWTMKAS
jgi:tripartite-type tricarboxylate transporter receptor subunit TctC